MTSKPSLPPPDASVVGADLGYYSHFPVLARALAMTSGPVLELGMGWGSTTLLHAQPLPRLIASCESDESWAKQFAGFDQGMDLRQILTVGPNSSWLDVIRVFTRRQQHLAFVLIDCSPGEIRKDLALKLKDHAEFIILHDHEAGPGAAYYYEKIIPRWKYAEVYRLLRPHTLVLSDTRPFGLSRFEQGFSS